MRWLAPSRPFSRSIILVLLAAALALSDAWAQQNPPDITGVWDLKLGAGRTRYSPIAILHTDNRDTMCYRVPHGVWVHRSVGALPPDWHPPMALPTPTAVTSTSGARQPAVPGTYWFDAEASHLTREQLNPTLPEDARKEIVQKNLWVPKAVVTANADGTLQVVWTDDEVRYNKTTGAVSDVYPRDDAPQTYVKRPPPPIILRRVRPMPSPFLAFGPRSRLPGDPFGDPFGWQPARVRLPRDTAFEVLSNLANGEPAFRPELGRGGVSWFVSNGDPYTGAIERDPYPVDFNVLIDPRQRSVQLSTADIDALIAQQTAAAEPQVAQELWQAWQDKNGPQITNNPNYGVDPRDPKFFGNGKLLDKLARQADGLGESRAWTQVGQMVSDPSSSGVGTVDLINSDRSFGRDGQFTLVRDANAVRIQGGLPAAMDAVQTQTGQHMGPFPADQLAGEGRLMTAASGRSSSLIWEGRVRSGFRTGGRVLMVAGAAYDGYRLYDSDDKGRTTGEILGGWATATLFAEGFALAWTPVDGAGPVAWVIHGVGTLVAGGIGYGIGSLGGGWAVDLARGTPCSGML